MKSDLETLAKTWETLGHEDPLWAVASHPTKRGGRWDITEFLATGEKDVAHCLKLITDRTTFPAKFDHVLDFGCGVGRLTRVWARYGERVTGVDISAAMLELAQKHLADQPHVHLVHNQQNDLRFLADNSVDLVFSLICLQHIPWSLAVSYIREFARVCRPGGIVAFQLPQRDLRSTNLGRIRKSLIEQLPFGLGVRYRRWRYGSSAVFDMHFTPRETVEVVTSQAGLSLIHAEPDASAGETTEGFFYIFKKPE